MRIEAGIVEAQCENKRVSMGRSEDPSIYSVTQSLLIPVVPHAKGHKCNIVQELPALSRRHELAIANFVSGEF